MAQLWDVAAHPRTHRAGRDRANKRGLCTAGVGPLLGEALGGAQGGEVGSEHGLLGYEALPVRTLQSHAVQSGQPRRQSPHVQRRALPRPQRDLSIDGLPIS